VKIPASSLAAKSHLDSPARVISPFMLESKVVFVWPLSGMEMADNAFGLLGEKKVAENYRHGALFSECPPVDGVGLRRYW
jgi:hypothetical protein